MISSLVRVALPLSLALVSTTALAAEKVGVVGALTDKVTARGEDGKMRNLQTGSDIFLNDSLISDSGGKAQIMFLDKSALTISANSEVVIDSFVYNPAGGTGDITLRSAKGALRFIGGALSKDKPATIKTPVSTIGIRGGIVDTHVESSGETDAIFLYGNSMFMENSKGERRETTRRGTGLTVSATGSRPAYMPPRRVAARMATFGPAPSGNSDTQNDSGDSSSTPAYVPPASGENNSESSGQATTSQIISVTNTITQSSQSQQRVVSNEQINNDNDLLPEPAFFGRYFSVNTSNILTGEGFAAFAPVNDKFIGFLLPDFDDEDREFRLINLPGSTNIGYNTIGAFNTPDNDVLAGISYASDNRAMFYYSLVDQNDGSYGAVAFGKTVLPDEVASVSAASIAASQAAGSHNISFYSFLPDISGEIPTGHRTIGFFDYNLIDNRLAEHGEPTPPSGNYGLAVDWSNKSFFSGTILWNNDQTTAAFPQRRDLVVAFGEVGDGQLELPLSGNVFEFNRNFVSGGFEEGSLSIGYVHADFFSLFAASPTSKAEGFLLEGVVSRDFDTDAFDPLDQPGRHILQPVMTDDGNSAAIAASANRSTSTTHGFSAGYVVRDAISGASAEATPFYNTSTSDVALTKDITSNQVGASIIVTDSTNPSASLEVQFGSYPGDSEVRSAFLANDIYGAQLGKVIYIDSANTETYTGDPGRHGVLVAAKTIASVSSSCTQCQYAEWGVWASEVEFPTSASGTVTEVAQMIPYVTGSITQDLFSNIGPLSLGNQTYRGVLYGASVGSDNVVRRSEGMFTSNIDLNNRLLTDFDANFAGYHFGFTGQSYHFPTSGPATFSNIAVNNLSGPSASGTINGALFGPQADDLAGNFYIQNSATSATATGIYLGTRK